MAAPSSALPIGTTSSLDDMALVKIDVGDVLLHTVLCVSNAELDHDAATAAEEEQLVTANLAGFIYVYAIHSVKGFIS